jgi:hypothetical protein
LFHKMIVGSAHPLGQWACQCLDPAKPSPAEEGQADAEGGESACERHAGLRHRGHRRGSGDQASDQVPSTAAGGQDG